MAEEYHARDFDWEDHRAEVERDGSTWRQHVGGREDDPPPPPSSDGGAEAWRSFHRRHPTGKFFKERRYFLKEFPELAAHGSSTCVLEVGCGNGSTALPILRAGEEIVVYGCDCSPDALDAARAAIDAADGVPRKDRFRPFLLDFNSCEFPKWLFCDSCRASSAPVSSPPDLEGRCCIGGVDFVTLVFTLSAVPSQLMQRILAACFSVLKPGGLLFFRDYGLYDMTMLRFPPAQRVGFREYRRCDGTLSYFFSLDVARRLFLEAGFIELELDYCCVRAVNRRRGATMRRVWVHGKFRKPL
ncbi:methyltransferase family protein [Wolffia australiana]